MKLLCLERCTRRFHVTLLPPTGLANGTKKQEKTKATLFNDTETHRQEAGPKGPEVHRGADTLHKLNAEMGTAAHASHSTVHLRDPLEF